MGVFVEVPFWRGKATRITTIFALTNAPMVDRFGWHSKGTLVGHQPFWGMFEKAPTKPMLFGELSSFVPHVRILFPGLASIRLCVFCTSGSYMFAV